MNDELPIRDFDYALYGQKCIECRWYFPDRKQKIPKCQKEKCEFESRKEHADKLLAQFNEIFDHPCGNCLNHLLCFQEGQLKQIIVNKDMIIMLPFGDDIFIKIFQPIPVTRFARVLKKYTKLGFKYLFTGTTSEFLDKYIMEKQCSKVKNKEEKEKNFKYWHDKWEREKNTSE